MSLKIQVINMSKGENYIASILKKEKIKFEREKTYNDLKHGKFRFDFYLPYIHGGCLLEFDGQQHFYQVAAFQKTRRDFLKQQEYDRLKNSYCLANNIRLYRIPYWELEQIKTTNDFFQEKFLVKDKWHNDNLQWR